MHPVLLPVLTNASSILDRRHTLAIVAGALISPALATGAQAGERIQFADIWGEGPEFSDRAVKLKGSTVEMRGYMAPPLKAEINFFVLTKVPTAICPFCDASAAWPDDIVMVKMSRPIHAIDYDRAIKVTGTLDIGDETDDKTGFVSRVRIVDATYSKV